MKRLAFLLLATLVVVTVYSCGDDGVVPAPLNQTPVPVGTIPEQEIPATDTVTVDVSSYFNDPDGDRLIYTASTSNPVVVTASVSASIVSVVAGEEKGLAAVTVTASDPGGLTATQSFAVTVMGKPGFLRVVLSYAERSVGAVVLRVEGPSIDSVGAGPNLTAYHVPTPQGVRAFVAGDVTGSETVLRFWSEDFTELRNYAASVEQAAGTTYEQRSVESANATVVR